ncbi:MAG: chemotaxis protein CheY [Gammaproteobacteria bacterium SG8_47]|nr:MAG: chemotaxis protein CheY [Gammaproteobacteria bacterium SG8_47]
MAIRVLVVDDSRFFRRRVTEILAADPLIEVIGDAENGAQAIEQATRLKPDVITMDIEMPVMDGISAVRRIMARQPVPILMFSSLTTDGAQATLDALDAGAVDFLPKRFEDISRDRDEANRLLCQRVRAIARRGVATTRHAVNAVASGAARATRPALAPRPPVHASGSAHNGPIRIVAIGTSTGGPLALQEVLTRLPASFPVPVLLIQHMPSTFTPTFAQRLNNVCAINVKEAEDGEELRAGTAYLAPGGRQMMLDGRVAHPVLRVKDSEPNQTYKPSVDVTFASVARFFPRETLAVVLTGMGADGRSGADVLKRSGSIVWAQDEQSSVVYGMPAAVAEAGLADQILSLKDIGPSLVQRV